MGLFYNKIDALQIIAFQSYGTDNHLYARGRALEDENIDLSEKGFFKLLLNTWKRFDADELRNTRLALKLPDNTVYYTDTDADGYYLFETPIRELSNLTNDEGWLSYEISYGDVNVEREITNENRFPGEMLVPSESADFGIISDIDDTILHTGVVSSLKWQVIKNTVFKRAETRMPLEGAAQFYHLLHRGRSGSNSNPVFYVSHSPWNLYRYLAAFLKINDFPKGPILLRSLSSFRNRKAEAEKPQKQREILNILKTYPSMKFILVGDSGEHDADIYIEIAESHPDRILAIYLRSVKHEQKMLRVRGLFENYKTTPVLLVEKSEDAMQHARDKNFIK
jgi:phosphatidate phosphatase APP1